MRRRYTPQQFLRKLFYLYAMENNPSIWNRLFRTPTDTYQVVIREEESLVEYGNFKSSPLKVYLLLLAAAVGVGLFVVAVLALTPLRKLLPDDDKSAERQEVAELESVVSGMEKQLRAQTLYIDNLLRTVRGEATTPDEVPATDALVDTSSTPLVPPSDAELQLRREVELDRLGDTSAEPITPPPAPGSDKIPLAQIYLVAPVNGEISARYNSATGHRGVDILAPQNTPIKACRDGVVFLSEFTSANGNVIGVQHDNDLISFYKHNSQLLKDVGDRVRTGEAIAIIGNTGELTSGPHLHFELWYQGTAVDPTGVLRF